MPISEYVREKWNQPRDSIAAAGVDTALAVTGRKFANIPAYAYQPRNNQKMLEISWTMQADAAGCAVFVYAARNGGDITLAYTTDLVAGKQLATNGGYYVDTIAAGTETWNTDIVIINGGNGDEMGRITLDTCGYRYFFCLFTGITGSETIQAHYSGY